MKAVITVIVLIYRRFMTKLNSSFYLGNTIDIAKALLGKYIVRETNIGKIVLKITETEAYIGSIDKACHSYNYKKTQRTATMFLKGGCAYVYMIYGMYNCLNVVTGEEGEPEAVLIRGGVIVEGSEYASIFRYNKPYESLNTYELKNITNGPGKLCKALNIDRSLDGHFLSTPPLYITEGEAVDTIKCGKRINIDYAEEAKDFMWRFYI